jgi:phage shock protein A
MDDRLNQRLEEQLAEAHARNAQLVQSRQAVQEEMAKMKSHADQASTFQHNLEQATLQLKQAESFATAAAKKQRDAERETDKLRVENEDLREKLERVQKEADQLTELNVRIADAKHVGDLLGGAS